MPRTSSRCNSCKHLRIACDKKRPKCEYCISTNRECVYDFLAPSSNKSKSISLQSTPKIKSGSCVTEVNFVDSDSLASFLCSQFQLNSAYRQLGVSRFEYRLLHFFNASFTNVHQEIKELQPYYKVWITEVPELWRHRMTVRKSINSFVLMALKAELNLNELLIEDFFHDENQETHGIPLFEHSSLGFQEELYETLLENIKAITYQDLDTRALEYFGQCLKETSLLIQTIITDESQLNAFTAFEMLIASSGLHTFLAMQPYGMMSLISFNDVQSDFLSHLVLLRSATERSFSLLIDSRYMGILSFNERMLQEPRINESYVITEELYRQFHEYQEHENEEEYVKDQILSGIRCFEVSIYRAIHLNSTAIIPRWLQHVEVELYDLMHKQHYFSLKLLYYYCALMLIYGMTPHKKSNMFFDFLSWFNLINYSDHRWQQYDQELYEVVQNELSLTDVKQLKTFNPADHLFREYTF